ncbi:peptide deformylase [Candidatus Peregrinibacteria bacterium]|nr:peptide deformylase [Candidatus Peregrinibacteria bacterium]MBI3816057.1 peptide deformylase [Candidatus Peregrinibacteria bacterium]
MVYTPPIAILPILIGADNPALRIKTRPIPKVTKKIAKLIKNMQETMEEANGVGLAAPQIGEPVRLCLATINQKLTPLINPQIPWRSLETTVEEEGCLSLPNVWLPVRRSTEIVVTYLDVSGKKQDRRVSGFDARVIQHEVDHLDGVLIVDYE